MAALTRLLPNEYAHRLPRPSVGRQVKLVASDGHDTERLWAEVRLALLDSSGAPLLYVGRVRSMSYQVEGWNYGEKVIFAPKHIHELLGWSMY
jgi:hypothetical protein